MKTAYVLCVIGTIIMGIVIVPLLWCIPMTRKVKMASEGEIKLSVSFAIAVCLFVSLLGGLLLISAVQEQNNLERIANAEKQRTLPTE